MCFLGGLQRKAITPYDVVIMSWLSKGGHFFRHLELDFWNSLKFQERVEIERKVIKTTKGTLIWCKNIKIALARKFFFKFKRDFPFSQKSACQNLVAMVTSSQWKLTDHFIFFLDKFLKKFWSYRAFFGNIRKIVFLVQSHRGKHAATYTPPQSTPLSHNYVPRSAFLVVYSMDSAPTFSGKVINATAIKIEEE